MMPSVAIDTELVRAAAHWRLGAPSLHNTQPWRWVSGGSGLRL